MGKSVSEFQYCARHRHPQQLQGVCPSCLREKLSNLRFNSTREQIIGVAPSCDSSTSYSPDSSLPDRRLQRKASEAVRSISYTLSAGSVNLRKSRSIAVTHGSYYGGGEKKKAGFFSKLFGFKGKKEVRSDLFGNCKREVLL